MWYRFEKGNTVGIPRIKNYQLAWYDMTMGGTCFDESFFRPDEIGEIMPYVETIEDEGNCDRSRVFVNFDDGERYELRLVRITEEQIKNRSCSNFYR